MEDLFKIVNNPDHYTTYGMEAIDVIENSMSKSEFEGFLKGNALKYLIRYQLKGNPEQDLRKCKWYVDKLIEVITNGKV